MTPLPALATSGGLAPALQTVRLFLHVLGATVWVGGQIVMVGLVPTARGLGGTAPRALARAFARVSWPAYLLVVVTGFWNVGVVHFASQSTAWKVVFGVKMLVVVLAGLGAYLHGRATTKAALAVWGSVAGVCSVAALLFGVLLAG